MKKIFAAAAVAALATVGFAGATQAADSHVKLGLLTCEVDPGVGLLVVSSKDVTCTFKPNKGKAETYTGSIKKLGIDVGFTAASRIAWVVVAAGKGADYNTGDLAGTYVGASHEATLGLGLGGNWLIGGSNKSIALQPWSIQGQVGLNWSLTWTDLTLE